MFSEGYLELKKVENYFLRDYFLFSADFGSDNSFYQEVIPYPRKAGKSQAMMADPSPHIQFFIWCKISLGLCPKIPIKGLRELTFLCLHW